MNVRDQLLALNDELRRLKSEGRRTVTISEDNLDQLRQAVSAVTSVRAEEAAPIMRSASVEGTSPKAASVDRAGFAVPAVGSGVAAFERAPVTPVASSGIVLPQPPPIKLPEGDKRVRWEALRDIVLNDPVCRARVFPGKKVVFGVGSVDASIMFVGEAPGADEEELGEPFVGRAGQLLNRMIKAMGVERSQVYIGNILNWRPEMPRNSDGSQTGNRAPNAAEMAYCLPFIREQIAVVQPRVLVALGKTAVDGLLGADRFKSMGAARGNWHTYANTPLRATYHPSYLLRQEGLTTASARKIKRDAWEDLLQVMELAGLPISDKQQKYFL